MARNNEFDFTFLKTKEAAQILRLSPRTLEAMRRNGKRPPFTRMGRDLNAKVAYRLADIRKWLADKTHAIVVQVPKFGPLHLRRHRYLLLPGTP